MLNKLTAAAILSAALSAAAFAGGPSTPNPVATTVTPDVVINTPSGRTFVPLFLGLYMR